MGVAGTFVTLEGIEASGKTTLLRNLAERLRAAGSDPVVTNEPGGTPAGDRLRALLLESREPLDAMTELFIVCAARAEHVASVIAPAVSQGRLVLCDRWSDATLAYQGAGRGLNEAVVLQCCKWAENGIAPRLTLLVDLSPAVSRQRVAARTRSSGVPLDRLEREDDAFVGRVRERYLRIAREHPDRVKVLNGMLPPDALLRGAWSHVAPLAGVA